MSGRQTAKERERKRRDTGMKLRKRMAGRHLFGGKRSVVIGWRASGIRVLFECALQSEKKEEQGAIAR